MAVRNFWVTTTVDGRATSAAAGPRAKDGGFSVRVQQRDGGGITEPLQVQGFAGDDGTLKLQVVANGQVIFTHTTAR